MHSVRQRREVAPIMTQHAAFPSTGGGEISVTCTRRTQIRQLMSHLHIHRPVFLHFVRLPFNHSTSIMTKAYLLSRTLDPLLAVFTGLFAFYLNQNNPRTAPPPGHTLQELLRWKWAESKKIREARDKEASEEWEKVARELVGGASAEEAKR